jgi:hypothetical protein
MAAGKNYETEVAAVEGRVADVDAAVVVEVADALEGDCKKRGEPEPEQVWRVPEGLEQVQELEGS